MAAIGDGNIPTIKVEREDSRSVGPGELKVKSDPDSTGAHLGAPAVRTELDLRARLPRSADRGHRHRPPRAPRLRVAAQAQFASIRSSMGVLLPS